MIQYEDYYNHTMGEIIIRIQTEWLQTTKKLISIETLPNKAMMHVRVWYRE